MLLAALTLLPAWVLSAEAAGQTIGTVAALRGSAFVRTSDGSAEAMLATNTELHSGEIVRTGHGSRLKLALRDGSTLALGADTELRLDNLAFDPGSVSTFTQFSGYVRAVIAPVRPGTQFEIRTPSMVAAVRGTDWIQNFEGGTTQIFVAQGHVQASGTGISAGERVLLSAGEGVTFNLVADNTRSPGGVTHTPVTRWKRAKIDQFVAATRLP